MSELVQESIDLQVEESEESTPTWPLPGAFLRAARETHGLSLEEVSQALKFGVRQLEALENDNYAQLNGGNTFLRGFVRSYARYLKLDESPLLAGLAIVAPAMAAEVRPVESMGAEMPVVGGENSKRVYWLAFGVLLLCVLAWFAWQGRPALERTSHVVSEQPKAATSVAPVSAPSPHSVDAKSSSSAGPQPAVAPAVTSIAAAPKPAAVAASPAVASATGSGSSSVAKGAEGASLAPATATATSTAVGTVTSINPNDRQLVLDFSAVAWVEVRDVNDHVIYSGNSTPNTQQTVRGRPPLQLVIGNARSVKLRYEDRAIDLQPYIRVDVARLTLDDNTK